MSTKTETHNWRTVKQSMPNPRRSSPPNQTSAKRARLHDGTNDGWNAFKTCKKNSELEPPPPAPLARQIYWEKMFAAIFPTEQSETKTGWPVPEDSLRRQHSYIQQHWCEFGLPAKTFHFTGERKDDQGFQHGASTVHNGKQIVAHPEECLKNLRSGYSYELVTTRLPHKKIYLEYKHLQQAIERALPEEYSSFFFSLPDNYTTAPRVWYEALETVLNESIESPTK